MLAVLVLVVLESLEVLELLVWPQLRLHRHDLDLLHLHLERLHRHDHGLGLRLQARELLMCWTLRQTLRPWLVVQRFHHHHLLLLHLTALELMRLVRCWTPRPLRPLRAEQQCHLRQTPRAMWFLLQAPLWVTLTSMMKLLLLPRPLRVAPQFH
jgi:hypothetical protein